jgi:hypothetical protein
MRPVILSFLSAADKLSDDQPSAKEENGEVYENLQALAVTEMQPGNGDVPAKREQCTNKEHQNAG